MASDLKQNLFYFEEEDNEDEEKKMDSPQLETKQIKKISQKSTTKQFNKVGQTTRMCINFFAQQSNIDATPYEQYQRSKSKNYEKDVPTIVSRKIQEAPLEKIIMKRSKLSDKSSSNESQVQNPEIIKTKSIQKSKQKSNFYFQNSQGQDDDDPKSSDPTSSGKQNIPVNDQDENQQIGQQHLQTHNEEDYSSEQNKIQVQKNNKTDQKSDNIKITSEEIGDIRTFLQTAIQKGKVLQCRVVRKKNIMLTSHCEYLLYTTDGNIFLMGSYKKSGNSTSNYYITLNNTQTSKQKDDYLGKLRSNWLGSQYIAYDSGHSPNQPIKGKNQRKTTCQIYYKSNIFKLTPKQLQVFIPNISEFCSQYKKTLKQLYRSNNNDHNVINLVNKVPKWSEQKKRHYLNFNGRVSVSSVKNMILIDKQEKNQSSTTYSLLFGKVSDNQYNLDVKYPLNPIQAFQIVLSSFDNKLVCE